MEQFDALIIGAGPAGSASALALLARSSLRVAVIHKPGPSGRYRIGESAAPSVSQLLRAMGLPCRLDNMGHTPCYGSISQWGGDAVEEQDFITQGQGHGWHLDREAFDDWLRIEAERRGARVFNDSQFLKLGRLADNRWGVVIRQRGKEKRLVCNSLIDASGRGARVAKQFDARRHNIDQLIALAYLTRPHAGHRLAHFSLVESHPLGWWYSAGLPDGRAIVCFMSDADIARQYQLTDSTIFTRLYHDSEQVAVNVPPPEKGIRLTLYPAHSGFIDRVAGNGWMAVGDAAIGMDPLTSSGINCALADGMAAATAITEYLSGDNRVLCQHANAMNRTVADYLRQRQTFYQREQRWSDRLFWRRRHARPLFPYSQRY